MQGQDVAHGRDLAGRRVIIAGGGTGGHAIPALCVAESLRALGASVEFIGSTGGIESTLVPDAGFTLHSLDLSGFAGNPVSQARAGVRTLRGVVRCRELLSKFSPHAVLGVGGYASAPAVLAARSLGIPTFLHEQNSVPGRVNRLASRLTKEVMITFPEAAETFTSASLVGMPTRGQFFDTTREEALSRLGLDPPVVFIFGGSGGALKINLAAEEAFGSETTPYTVVQVTGKRDFSRITTTNPRHVVLEYADSVWDYVAAADVVVSRAGAGSLFDVAAAGRAAVLIPFPFATGDHQLHNARYFTERHAAELLLDEDVDAASLKHRVELLLTDSTRRHELENNIKRLATPNAARDVALRLIPDGTDGTDSKASTTP